MTDPLVDSALARAAGALPAHEDRPEQREMAEAVGAAIRVAAPPRRASGHGHGQEPGLSGARAGPGRPRGGFHGHQSAPGPTGAPRPAAAVALAGARFEFAVLKGRSNYICRQRVNEISGGGQQLALGESDGPEPPQRWAGWAGRCAAWWRGRAAPRPPASQAANGQAARRGGRSAGTPGRAGRALGGGHGTRRIVSGDRAELSFEPSEAAWAQVSTGLAGMPGRRPVPLGRRVLRRGGPPPGRPKPTSWWSTPTFMPPPWPSGRPTAPRARPGRLRRGPRARGHRLGRARFRPQPGPAGGPGPPGPPPGGGGGSSRGPGGRRRGAGRRPAPAPGPGAVPAPARRSLRALVAGPRAGQPGPRGVAQGQPWDRRGSGC